MIRNMYEQVSHSLLNKILDQLSPEVCKHGLRHFYTRLGALNDEALVVGNFHNTPQSLTLSDLGNRGQFEYGQLKDLCTDEAPAHYKDQLVIPPFRFYWLKTH